MKTIGIIGGKGKMGSAFADLFRRNEYEVLISDKGTPLSNKKLIQKSDIILVSVPIVYTEKVLSEVAEKLKKPQTLIEITSVKTAILPVLKKVKGEVVSLHPMCNHTQLKGGAHMLMMSPKRKGATYKAFKQLFKREELIVSEVDIHKHDKLMSLLQGLPHFAEISFAHTMQKLGFKTKQLTQYASPATELKLKMVGRILAQKPELYGAIQIYNEKNVEILAKHVKSVQELYEIVQRGDMDGFIKYFASSARSLGNYKDEALAKTDEILNTLSEEMLTASRLSNIVKKGRERGKGKKVQSSQKIGLLGPEFTYTDIASNLALKRLKRSSEYKKVVHKEYFSRIDEVCNAVEKGEVALGIIPIENRLQGTVRDTLDALFERNLHIIHELELPIEHCLAVLPGVKKKDVSIIMSHPQALSQCAKYLRKRFPKADQVGMNSSAKAYETVSRKKFRHIAVIGPKVSASHYGFTILDDSVSDNRENATKFIVIQKAQKQRTSRNRKAATSTLAFPNLPSLNKQPKKTSIVFYFSNDKAGSLFTVFQAFAEHGVNMTKVESRPYKADFGNYLFFIDFEGNLAQKKVRDTLSRVASLTSELKILGCY